MLQLSIPKCLFYCFVFLKIKWLLIAYFSPDRYIEHSNFGLFNYNSFLTDPELIEFPLMDRVSVRFELQPKKCNHSMIVLVLSAPANIKQRNILRREIKFINNGEFLTVFFTKIFQIT